MHRVGAGRKLVDRFVALVYIDLQRIVEVALVMFLGRSGTQILLEVPGRLLVSCSQGAAQRDHR